MITTIKYDRVYLAVLRGGPEPLEGHTVPVGIDGLNGGTVITVNSWMKEYFGVLHYRLTTGPDLIPGVYRAEYVNCQPFPGNDDFEDGE